MSQQVVLVTGAAGFLGSAITVDLSADRKVIALDRRLPTRALLDCTAEAIWRQVDIADRDAVATVFSQARDVFGRIDFVVHFAAYYHFGADWREEYESTNVRGTDHVLRAAAQSGVRRVIFASSVAAMQPPPPGETLTETAATDDYIPYARSKSAGEKMVAEASARVAGISLRIGGAFSGWSELPPLTSLIELWATPSPISRLVVGHGTAGIPYVHRHDVVRIVRACIDRHQMLEPWEVLLACDHGAVLHHQLFAAIHGMDAEAVGCQPILISPRLAKIGLLARRAWGLLGRNSPFERPWMLNYADRPWVVDTTYTRRKLQWSCTPGMGILDQMPTILKHFRHDQPTWDHRNRLRNQGQYAYHPDEDDTNRHPAARPARPEKQV